MLFARGRALPQQDEHPLQHGIPPQQQTSPPCPPPPSSTQLGIPPPQHGMPPLQLGMPPPQHSMPPQHHATDQWTWERKHSTVAGILCLVAVGGVILAALGYRLGIIAIVPAGAVFLCWLGGRIRGLVS